MNKEVLFIRIDCYLLELIKPDSEKVHVMLVISNNYTKNRQNSGDRSKNSEYIKPRIRRKSKLVSNRKDAKYAKVLKGKKHLLSLFYTEYFHGCFENSFT